MLKTYNVYCDGGARGNPGPAASAFVVYNSERQIIVEDSQTIGFATNNQAEYQAVFIALRWLSLNIKADSVIRIYLDSLLLVNQLSGKYKVKNTQLKDIYIRIKEVIRDSGFIELRFIYVPRNQNSRADFLVNLALDQNRGR